MAIDTALVTITVDATVQANDDTATTTAGTPVTVPILANDIVNGVTGPTVADLDGPPAILSITPEDAGIVTVNEDGEIEFTPAAGFCGQVQVEYSVEKTCDASTDCASFNIEFDNGGWGPRNFLSPSSMSNLPSGFVPGATAPQIVVTVGSTPVVFNWFGALGQYVNYDYLVDPGNANWPATTFQWGGDPGTVSCVDVAFLPRV